MTAPNNANPNGALNPGEFNAFQAMTEADAKAAMTSGARGSIGNAHDVHNVAVTGPINDHSQSITQIQAVLNQLILQGNALVFTSNNTYTPSAGITSIEVIIIGAGAGGAAGRWDALHANRRAGGGGGGGGEVHTSIPASLLPVNGSGNFLPISITVGAGGPGGTADGQSGTGGGNTSFGSFLTAGGGNGGVAVNSGGLGSGGGVGGSGMIPGGQGAHVGIVNNGGNSVSQYSLSGGGGGGGAGIFGDYSEATTTPSYGGNGGISAGGAPGQPGTAPSSVVATGGGGGGGSASKTSSGGAGAFPAGGGGGGGGSLAGPRGNGGNGGAGILYVVERVA